MKRVLLAACAALGVTACAEGYYGPYGGGGMAYYDDYYGPYDTGYWGPDGYFYYHNREHGYVRDVGNHFRRGATTGFHGVQAHSGMHGFAHGGGHGGDHPHG